MPVDDKMIVALGQKAGYLEARSLAAGRGMRLPSNVLHDDYLVRTGDYKGVRKIYPAWAREILVHPEKGGEFKKGEDVVDSETRWIVPGSYLTDPKLIDADPFRKGVGLFIDPEDVIIDNERIVVIPGSIVLLDPFIQINDATGTADETTRVPLGLPPQDEQGKRWLYRRAGVGVRPLARGPANNRANRRNVIGFYGPFSRLGVAGEASEGPLRVIEDNGGLIVRGSPAQVAAAAKLLEQLK